jgi:TonB-linked SusC/RagA family outer membrane protein
MKNNSNAKRKKRLLHVLTLAILLSAIHARAWAQNEKIALDVKDVSIRQFFDKIEAQSEYRFTYRDWSISDERQITYSTSGEAIESLLQKTLTPLGLQFQISRKDILITRKTSVQKEDRIFSGTVVDSNGEPVIGASIAVKGTKIGTVTDANGKFALEAPDASLLSVSYFGYVSKDIKPGENMHLPIVLQEDRRQLEEVIVIGYGIQKKSDLTGAVSSIKTDELTITSDASVGQLIKGKAAGVTVLSTSAQPGGGVDILVRGAASVGAGNAPLFVIDGFPISNATLEPSNSTQYSQGDRSPLNSLNPNDIESIEILKDASATAIYGARAANGVILITTKRGKQGLKLNYDGSYTTQVLSKPFEVFNAHDYMNETNKIMRERWLRENKIAPYGTADPATLQPFSGRFTEEEIANAGTGTNWWDEIMRAGLVNNQNISITYGNGQIRTYASLGYYSHDGVVNGSRLERISSKINLDWTINPYLNAGISHLGSIINNDNIQAGDGEWGDSNMIMAALLYDPSVPVKDEEGNYSEMSWYANLPNPVSYNDIDDQTKQTRNLSNFFLQIEPVKNLLIRTSIGYDGQSSVRKTYFPKTFLLGKQNDGKANISQINREDFLFDATATFNRAMAASQLTVMAGYAWQEFNDDGYSLGAAKFFTDVFQYNNIGVGDEEHYSIGSYKNKSVLASYFGRLNYSLLNRYLLTVNMRYDGSDKFGQNNKWGFFPSASIGWRLSEEEFLKGFKPLSNLKVRTSYGKTGNSNIGSNAFSFYSVARKYAFNSTPAKGAQLDQIENPSLRWESTTELNIGLDLGLFKNRIAATVEYFDKTISDLLGYRNLRSWMVVPVVAANLGKTQSRGVEITLNTVNIDHRDFKWNTDFTYTSYRDRWKERSADVVLSPWQKVDDPIRAIHYYQYDGIIQIGESVPHQPNAVPGNSKIKDVNGFDENMNYTGHPDGKIDEADMVYLGSGDPGFSIGFNNTFKYRNFDLNIYGYGSFNLLVRNWIKLKYIGYSSHMVEDGTNLWVEASNRWSSDNTSGIYPGDATNTTMGSDAWVIEDASFFRIKNITLGYNLPPRLLPEIIGKARIYIDAQNLWVISRWTGMDPEVDGSRKAPYPNQRSYSIGLNVQF